MRESNIKEKINKNKLHAMCLINQTSWSSPVCSLPVYVIVLEIIFFSLNITISNIRSTNLKHFIIHLVTCSLRHVYIGLIEIFTMIKKNTENVNS